MMLVTVVMATVYGTLAVISIYYYALYMLFHYVFPTSQFGTFYCYHFTMEENEAKRVLVANLKF